MKILLATDGSSYSEAAVAEVARRSWPEASEIKVLSAFELPVPGNAGPWAIPASYFEELDRSGRVRARAIVDGATRKLRSALGPAVVVKGEFVQGAPKSAILEEADRWHPDLIVVGSHGYSAWQRFLLGSVSQSVVSHAKCSVEVVRPPKPQAWINPGC